MGRRSKAVKPAARWEASADASPPEDRLEDQGATRSDWPAGPVASASVRPAGRLPAWVDALPDWPSVGRDDWLVELVGGPGRAWGDGRQRPAAGRQTPAPPLASAAPPGRGRLGPGQPAQNPFRACSSPRRVPSHPPRAQSRCRAFAEDRVDRAAAQPANTTRGSGQAETLRNAIPTLPQRSGSALAAPEEGAEKPNEAQRSEGSPLRIGHRARAAGGTSPSCSGGAARARAAPAGG